MSSMSLNKMVRVANINDLETINLFNKYLAWETESIKLDDEKIANGVKTIINDPTKGQYFVYEVSGKVVGQLLITYEYSDWRNANIWWIQSVYVDKDFRRQGIFQSLYNHVKEIVSSRNDIAGLRLYVDKENVNAQKTYQALGMKSHYSVYEWLK